MSPPRENVVLYFGPGIRSELKPDLYRHANYLTYLNGVKDVVRKTLFLGDGFRYDMFFNSLFLKHPELSFENNFFFGVTFHGPVFVMKHSCNVFPETTNVVFSGPLGDALKIDEDEAYLIETLLWDWSNVDL